MSQTATKPKIRRLYAGRYTVTSGGKTVVVFQWISPDEPKHPCNGWWVAGAEWDRHNYTDQIPLKRDAIECAKAMLEDAMKVGAR